MIQSPEILAKIATIRAKVADGTATLDDVREGVRMLREGRLSAAAVSDTARRKRAVKEIPDANSLMNELEGL